MKRVINLLMLILCSIGTLGAQFARHRFPPPATYGNATALKPSQVKLQPHQKRNTIKSGGVVWGPIIKLSPDDAIPSTGNSLPLRSTCSYFLPGSCSAKGTDQPGDTLIIGGGYWNKLGDPIPSFAGTAVLEDSTTVTAHWNLIGSVSSRFAVVDIVSPLPGIVRSKFFGRADSYVTTDTIFPGRMYWVKADWDDAVILSSSGTTPSIRRISVVPTDDLSPPQGGSATTLKPSASSRFSFAQYYPNPFNPVTDIRYAVGSRQYVRLQIYDVLGRVVATLVDEMQEAGFKSVRWDAGREPSGVYFYRLTSGTFSETKKLIVMR